MRSTFAGGAPSAAKTCTCAQRVRAAYARSVGKGVPLALHVSAHLVASVERDTSRQYELDVRLLVGEIRLQVPGVERRNVAIEYALRDGRVLFVHGTSGVATRCASRRGW
jgi:hypothetical protein